MKRNLIGETPKCVGKPVKLCGWVDTRRDHGKIIFIDLRDRTGLAQVVFAPDLKPEVYESAKTLRPEWVVSVEGEVSRRPEKMRNPKIETGGIEIKARSLKVFSKAKTLPFAVDSSGYEINEEKRLKYRYLDLKRSRLQKNLRVRHAVCRFIRDFLAGEDFVEVETPILTKSTPEGARDFLVPARLYPGKFYALPQSPQQYKQLLQISGIERYFQIAKAIRDEDPRADRQAEHTQLDLEMSFVSRNEILDLVEKLFTALVQKLFPEKKIKEIPFPRMTYEKAMEKYETDRPDLRSDPKDPNLLAFSFVTDFPMFEWHAGDKKWGAMHHPFTRPQTEDAKEIKKDPEKVLAHQYDLVLNGYEIGGGSIRNTDLETLTAVFEVLGYKKEEIKGQFRHYFEAFSYGVPPHGGIAVGLDRFLATVLAEPNIREVIAFPKTGDNRDLMMDVPSEVSKKQLEELRIKVSKPKK